MTADIIVHPDNRHKATRRRLLAGAIGAAAAPRIPSVGAATVDPIIALIAEEDRWRSLAVKARGIADDDFFARPDRSDNRETGPLYAEAERLEDIAGELYNRIVDTPALTLAGVLAKFEFAGVGEPSDDPD
jgi:hypothetical protein